MKLITTLLAGAALAMSTGVFAQEAAIRKTLSERIPQLQNIDEIAATPMKGLYEVRVGTDLFYTDAAGNYLIQGELIDTKARRNITEDRITKLTAVDFNSLPFADAFKIVRGNGKRQIAVFEDPNCGYCKAFRHTLEKVNNVTIHTFVVDILGPKSTVAAKQLLCAKDQGAAWDNWMLRQQLPDNSGACDTSVLDKNKALAQQLGVTGTPTIIFENGKRIPGAPDAATLEEMLTASKK